MSRMIRSITGLNKHKVKVRFAITFERVDKATKSNDHDVFAAWKRGSRKTNRGETKRVACSNGTAVWNESAILESTLLQDVKSKKFDEKSLNLAVKEERGKSKKSSVIGKATLNLGDLANNGASTSKTLLLGKSKDGMSMSVRVKAEWLKVNNKLLIRANSPQAAGFNKDDITVINGEEFFLKTDSGSDSDDDMSETGSQFSEGDVADLDDFPEIDDDDDDDMFKKSRGGSSSSTASSSKPGESSRSHSASSKDLGSHSSSSHSSSKKDGKKDDGKKDDGKKDSSSSSRSHTSASLKATDSGSKKDDGKKDDGKKDDGKKDGKKESSSSSTTSSSSSSRHHDSPSSSSSTAGRAAGSALATTTSSSSSSSSSTDDVAQLKKDLEAQKAVSEKRWKLLSQQEDELTDLRAQLDKAKSGGGGGGGSAAGEVDDLKKQLAATKATLKSKEDELSKVRAGSGLAGAAAGAVAERSFKDEIQKLKDDNQKLKDDKAKLEKDLVEAQSRIKELEKGSAAATTTTSTSSSSSSSRSSKSGDDSEIKKLKDEIKQLKEDLKEEKDKHRKSGSSSKSSSSSSSSSSTSSEDSDKLRDEIKQLKDRIKELEGSSSSSSSRSSKSSSSSSSSSSDDVKRLEGEVARSDKEVQSLKRQLETAATDLREERAAATSAQEAVKRLEKQLTDTSKSGASGDDRAAAQQKIAEQLLEEKYKMEEELKASLAKLKKTKKQFDELQGEMDQLRKDNAALKKELANGGGKAATAAAAATTTAAATAAASSGAEATELRGKLEELRDELKDKDMLIEHVFCALPTPETLDAIYRQETPVSAAEVVDYLLDIDAFNDDPPEQLFSRIVNAIEVVAGRCRADAFQLTYWLSTACNIVHLLKAESVGFERDPVVSGVQVPSAAPKPKGGAVARFEAGLQSLACTIYQHLLTSVTDQLDPLLPMSVFGVAGSSSEAARRALGEVKIREIKHILNELVTRLQDNFVFSSVMRQLFQQLFYYMGGSILNTLLKEKEHCKAGIGFQIKLLVSQLDDWIQSTDPHISKILSPARQELDPIVQASNVMVIDKKIFASDDKVFKTTFPALNIVQIKRLLDLFTPDDYAPDPVPPNVKNSVAATAASSRAPLYVDLATLLACPDDGGSSSGDDSGSE